MFRIVIILCACLLNVAVKTNPVLQGFPGKYSDQNAYRSSSIDFPNIFSQNFIPPTSQILQYEKSDKNDKLYKLFQDRLANIPVAFDIIKKIQNYNNDDISNYLKSSGNVPNIVNNYIILPPEGQTENILRTSNNDPAYPDNNENLGVRVKNNVDKKVFCKPAKINNTINFQNKIIDDQQTVIKAEINHPENVLENAIKKKSNQKDSIRKTLKRSLEEINKSKQRDSIFGYLNQNQHSSNLSSYNENGSKKSNKSESKGTSKRGRKDKEIKGPDNKIDRSVENCDDRKKITNSNKAVSSIRENHSDNKKRNSKLKKSTSQSKISELAEEKQTKPEKYNKQKDKQITAMSDNRHKKKFGPKNNKNIQKASPLVTNDYNDMYKYIETLLSNYQLTNTNSNNEFPFDYSNFYHLSQPPAQWNSINTLNNKVIPHKRRKLQRLRGKRLNKKRTNLRNKQKEKKNVNGPHHELNTDKETILSQKNIVKLEGSVKLTDKILTQTNMVSLEEMEKEIPNQTKDLKEMLSSNNTFTEEASHYNSYPSFILGTEDTVPIIFENGFIDDYYPDFTADNESLYLNPDENYAKMYHNGQYYVSNHNFNLEEYIKKRKGLAMHNINTNSKLFFSEKGDTEDEMISEQGTARDEEIDSNITFQSPPLLDNPDFRTRKIESNERYEPYYYHNVFHDPDEDFNKYYLEQKEIVYPINVSLKNNAKNKLFNEIDDNPKSKWKKIKDSDVETIYARSKLAKYGLVL